MGSKYTGRLKKVKVTFLEFGGILFVVFFPNFCVFGTTEFLRNKLTSKCRRRVLRVFVVKIGHGRYGSVGLPQDGGAPPGIHQGNAASSTARESFQTPTLP